jgi:RHS repeat-associated protein
LSATDTDPIGALQTTYSYEPFGNVIVTGTGSNPFQFMGRENDETDLYFYRARYYQPSFQRFISEDPIGLLGGMNLYSLVGENPINFVDPLGLSKCPSFGDSFRFASNATRTFAYSVPSYVVRGSVGILTAGITARTFGTVTFLQAVRSVGVGGIANLGVTGTLASGVITSGLHAAAGIIALETGIAIGSGVFAISEALGNKIIGCD